MNRLIRHIGRNRKIYVLLIIGLFFVYIYGWLYRVPEHKFTSPDETSNYFYIQQFANQNKLSIDEPLNVIAQNVIHPRSMNVVNGTIVPGSFLGMILIYGSIAKIAGMSVVPLLTPLFGVAGIVFFYLLLRKIFSERVAFVSAVLVFVNPVFWYYASRGLFHAVLFISLCIAGIYFFMHAIHSGHTRKTRIALFAVSGLLIGLSLITRTSECTWVFFVLLGLWLSHFKKIRYAEIALFGFMVCVTFIPIFYYNNQLYGSVFTFSYTAGAATGSIEAVEGVSTGQRIFDMFFPFGVNIGHAAHMAFRYVILAMPWFSILLIALLIWTTKNAFLNRLKKIFASVASRTMNVPLSERVYVYCFIFVAVWLILYYGSFVFSEFRETNRIILGSSYLRYWLPLYVFATPLIVKGMFRLRELWEAPRVQKIVSIFFVVIFLLLPMVWVINDPLYGLMATKKNTEDSIALSRSVMEVTHPGAVIIAGNADKVFFPERRVIANFPTSQTARAGVLHALYDRVPLYFFYSALDLTGENIILFLRTYGYTLVEIKQFHQGGDATLFKIEKL